MCKFGASERWNSNAFKSHTPYYARELDICYLMLLLKRKIATEVEDLNHIVYTYCIPGISDDLQMNYVYYYRKIQSLAYQNTNVHMITDM